MNYLDLFSGIGGFHKGFCDAGWKFDKVFYSEVDRYADKIYKNHFPDSVGLGDVSKIKVISHDTTASREQQGIQQGCKECSVNIKVGMGTQQFNNGGSNGWTTNITNGTISHTFAGKIDLITFGFPCQDLSIAGKRAGLKGSRSGLFYEATRLIRECHPGIFIFENVKGLFSADEGTAFERCL